MLKTKYILVFAVIMALPILAAQKPYNPDVILEAERVSDGIAIYAEVTGRDVPLGYKWPSEYKDTFWLHIYSSASGNFANDRRIEYHGQEIQIKPKETIDINRVWRNVQSHRHYWIVLSWSTNLYGGPEGGDARVVHLPASTGIFQAGFETGDTSEWSVTHDH